MFAISKLFFRWGVKYSDIGNGKLLEKNSRRAPINGETKTICDRFEEGRWRKEITAKWSDANYKLAADRGSVEFMGTLVDCVFQPVELNLLVEDIEERLEEEKVQKMCEFVEKKLPAAK